MDFKKLQRMAKNVIDKRGGTEALKADAEELKNIATGPGTASDKAKRAADALKDPGAKGPDKTADAPVTPPAEAPKPPGRARGDPAPGHPAGAAGRRPPAAAAEHPDALAGQRSARHCSARIAQRSWSRQRPPTFR